MSYISRKLYETIREKGFVCVGLDSHMDYIPTYIKKKIGRASCRERVCLYV